MHTKYFLQDMLYITFFFFHTGTGVKAGDLYLVTEPWCLLIIMTTREDMVQEEPLSLPSGMRGKAYMLIPGVPVNTWGTGYRVMPFDLWMKLE